LPESPFAQKDTLFRGDSFVFQSCFGISSDSEIMLPNNEKYNRYYPNISKGPDGKASFQARGLSTKVNGTD
jgi:hypothetical protein